MATKRKSLSKKTRFEVFKRDSFTCQYCGKQAPDVILHVDHIEPVSKGGDNEIVNLITSCVDCNAGKGARALDDQSTLSKQRAQLAELSERREQLEMMVKWREGLKSLKESETEMVAARWEELMDGQYQLNPNGLQQLRALLRKFGASAVMDGMDIAADQYLKFSPEGKISQESVGVAFRKVGGVCAMAAMPESKRRLYYIRGIVRNRMYCNEATAHQLLEEALEAGASPDEMERAAKTARNWTQWTDWMNDIIEGSQP